MARSARRGVRAYHVRRLWKDAAGDDERHGGRAGQEPARGDRQGGLLMKVRLFVAVVAFLAFGAGFRETLPSRAFVLANEPIVFDGMQPRFSEHQLRDSAPAIRAGLARWAATESGRRIIERINTREFRVTVVERNDEDGLGRAPEPSIGMLVDAADHAKVKSYELILNPEVGTIHGFQPVAGTPFSPADMMAIAWAAEMLHIEFYSEGISLPHHNRADFQEKWRAVAAELGFPSLRHDDAVDEEAPRRARIIYWR